jgi:L-asparagine oxygenase
MIAKFVQQIAEQGYAVVMARNESAVLEIATKLGIPLEEAREPGHYRVISPTPREISRPNTLSSRYGTGRFPFHTDTAYWLVPPRYLLLHCKNPGSGGRPTLLIDSSKWRLNRNERSALLRGIWIVGDKRPFLATILARTSTGMRIRYDRDCMRPAASSGELAAALITRKVRSSRPSKVTWSRGMLLILDNHRMLHARGAANASDLDRQLARVLVGEKP